MPEGTFFQKVRKKLLPEQIHEFLPGLCLVEGAAESTRGGDGILLLHTAHLHAHVAGFQDHHHTHGVKRRLDAVHDLLGDR